MATRSAAKKAEKEENIEAPKGKKEATPKGDVPAKKKESSSKFGADQVITLLVNYNPKRPSSESCKRFEKYEDEMTVAQALKKGVTAGDLNWDVAHGFIKIADEFDKDAEKKSKPEPKPRAKKEGTAEGKKPARSKGKKKEEEEEEEER